MYYYTAVVAAAAVRHRMPDNKVKVVAGSLNLIPVFSSSSFIHFF